MLALRCHVIPLFGWCLFVFVLNVSDKRLIGTLLPGRVIDFLPCSKEGLLSLLVP